MPDVFRPLLSKSYRTWVMPVWESSAMTKPLAGRVAGSTTRGPSEARSLTGNPWDRVERMINASVGSARNWTAVVANDGRRYPCDAVRKDRRGRVMDAFPSFIASRRGRRHAVRRRSLDNSIQEVWSQLMFAVAVRALASPLLCLCWTGMPSSSRDSTSGGDKWTAVPTAPSRWPAAPSGLNFEFIEKQSIIDDK